MDEEVEEYRTEPLFSDCFVVPTAGFAVDELHVAVDWKAME